MLDSIFFHFFFPKTGGEGGKGGLEVRETWEEKITFSMYVDQTRIVPIHVHQEVWEGGVSSQACSPKKICRIPYFVTVFSPETGGVGGGVGLKVREKRKPLLRKEFHLYSAIELGDYQIFGFRVRILQEFFF